MLEIRSGYAATALDLQQVLDTFQGWSVDLDDDPDACEVIVDSHSSQRLEANGGTVYLDGDEHQFYTDTITLDSPDPSHPRRDVIYIDDSADLAVESGDPQPYYPDPAEEMVDLGPWDVFTPSPHSMHDIPGVVIAEVLVVEDDTLRVRDRRMDAELTTGLLSAHRAQVSSPPGEATDVLRYADIDGLDPVLEGGTLDGHLNADGNNITNVGVLGANRVTIGEAPASSNDAVRYSFLDRFYRRSGDRLTGDMDANSNSIEDAGAVEADHISASETLDIPVVSGTPDEGMLWWDEDAA